MIKQLAIYEPAHCQCDACKKPCRHGKPGCLAPSDLDHIAEYVGLDEATETFILGAFKARADGPRAASEGFPDGETPAIRPRVTGNGRCVFLGKNDECTIYPVRPFECGRVNTCDPAAGAAAMKSLGKAIIDSTDYMQTWLWIRRNEKAE